ncbi:hypothetical protein [Candidatus Enterococcus murrayae]|uniref:Lipoprotein n=1 Tax=Candidatus Enterococcus murrayae TaxID=2815321 RepID=A0ABS3HLL2_9ENTE|nr:hypothetical protein [Enterococcus sp. MJM16]MBO0453902.1 hypothetical protein [Enterococcus sp. MJM16]
MKKVIMGLGICLCLVSIAGCKTEKKSTSKESSGVVKVLEKYSSTKMTKSSTEAREEVKNSSSDSISELSSDPNAAFFSQLPKEFTFTSGAGGWQTVLKMDGKGGFTGIYADYDASEVHQCDFKGNFKNVEQISEFEYKMSIGNLEVTGPQAGREGKYEVIPTDRIYGLDDANEMRVYLPGRSTTDLPKEFIDWMYHPMKLTYDNLEPELPFYGIYNVGSKQGFSSEDVEGYREKMTAQVQEKQNDAPVNMTGNWTIKYTDDSTIGSFEVKEDGSGVIHSTTTLMGQEGDLPFDEIEFKKDVDASWDNGYYIRFKKPMEHNDLLMEKRVVLVDQNNFRMISYTESGVNNGSINR